MRKKTQHILMNIALFIFTILICLLMFEATLRYLGMSCSIKDETGKSPYIISEDTYRMKPNYDGRSKCVEWDVKIQTNSNGYRDSEFNAFDKIIFLFGDSMVFGSGVEQNEVFTEVLEKVFLKGFSVYNFGTSGFSPKDYVRQYDEYIPKFNPKLIIVTLYDGNDAQEDCGLIKRVDYIGSKRKGFGKVKDILKKLYIVRFTGPLIKNLIDLGESSITAKQFYLVDESEIVKKCNKVLKNNLKVLKNKALDDNKKIIFMILPSKANCMQSNNPKIDYNKKANTLLEFCSELDLICLNLKDHMKNPSELYLKEGHLNKGGHYKVAEVINEFVIERDIL